MTRDKMEDLLALLLKREIRLTEDFINNHVSVALRENPAISEVKVVLSSGSINVSVQLKPGRWLMPASFAASLTLEKLAFSPSEHRVSLKLHSVKDIEYQGALRYPRSRMAAASAEYILRRPQVLAKALSRANLGFLSASDGMIQLNLDKLAAFTRFADKEVRILLIK
ncbi:MAG TPA: hypothetical protein VK905_02490, partial [Bacillota bacterium]|nr:hypothetical protein [Bacillota bacterium]